MFELIFDFRCYICGEISKENICEKCLKLFDRENIQCCPICGYPDNGRECLSCKNHNKIYYDSYNFIQYYYDYCKKLIVKLKMQYDSGVLKIFEKLIKEKKLFDKDLPVMFVPDNIFTKYFNYNSRFNKLEKILAKDFNIVKTPLAKKFFLKKQKNKSYKDRIENIEKLYFIKDKNHKAISDEIILFDDIYTSGSTINYCSKLLKEIGYKKVHIRTIFRSFHSIPL